MMNRSNLALSGLKSPATLGDTRFKPRIGGIASLSQNFREVRVTATGKPGAVAAGGAPTLRSPTDAKEGLLRWCRSKTKEYDNVEITNFSSSWADGLAFCALIHHYFPDAFDYKLLDANHRRKNFELAFRMAEEKANVVPLLDVDDMILMKNRPDWKCVLTYVQSIYRKLRELDDPTATKKTSKSSMNNGHTVESPGPEKTLGPFEP